MVLTNLFKELKGIGFKRKNAQRFAFSLLESDRANFRSLDGRNKQVRYPSLADYDNEGGSVCTDFDKDNWEGHWDNVVKALEESYE